MDNRYVQQFKKGSLEMILLCLIGRKETYGYEIITELNNSAASVWICKRRYDLSHPVPFAGSRPDSMPVSPCHNKRRL